MSLWKLERQVRRAARIQGAVRRPGRYAKNRGKSKALGMVGFWRLWSRFWRL